MRKYRHQISRDGKSLSTIREIRQVFYDWVGKLLPIGRDLKHSQQEIQESDSTNSGPMISDAVFIGWQEIPTGKKIALYNVTAKDHPLYHSTVSDITLRKQNLKVPQTLPIQRNK